MPLRDLLKKKDKQDEDSSQSSSAMNLDVPEFTFIRTTTNAQEVIEPPTYPGDQPPEEIPSSPPKRHSRFRRHSHTSKEAQTSNPARPKSDRPKSDRPKSDRRLSERLHLGSRSRSASTTSVNVPAGLPEIQTGVASGEDEEAQWEKRATLLAKGNNIVPSGSAGANREEKPAEGGRRSRSVSVSDKREDDHIQDAIRLHEEGDLQRSTEMFGRLADPGGANNALSQVLYGLALR
jgi:hypothetical protein